jgi:uncharacterized protein DUF2786
MAFDWTEKITGLLRKAEAEGTTPEESEIIRQKAYELMTKHSIDQAVIDAKRAKGESTQEEVVTDTISFTGIYKDALVQFCHNITMSFRTMTGYVEKNVYVDWENPKPKRVRGHVYTVVGYESDVRQVRVLLVSLQLQALADLEDWWRSDEYASVIRSGGTPMQKFKTRREFIMSFSIGAASKIKERMARAMNEAGPGTEVAIRTRLDEVRAWLEANRELSKSRGRGMERGSFAATEAGRSAGRAADTGEARVGPQRTAIGS